MSSPPAPRLALAPLADALGIPLLGSGHHDGTLHAGAHRLAAVLDIEPRSVVRWKANGIPITARRLTQLEDICDSIRRHPATVWGHAWYRATTDLVDGEPDDWYSDDPPLADIEPLCRRSAA